MENKQLILVFYPLGGLDDFLARITPCNHLALLENSVFFELYEISRQKLTIFSAVDILIP